MSRSHHAKAVCGGDAPSPAGKRDAFVAIPKAIRGEAPLAHSATRSSQLHIANRQRVRKINLRLLKKIAAALLTELEIQKAEIGICLAAAPEMTRLNETFLKHKGSTDVITFDHSAPRSQTPDASPKIHGEIFICVDEAVLQAREFGTNWQSEAIRYLVHGVLHLLGFDDSSAGVRREMKREENRRLREITRRFPLSKL